ncbi:uncharacterized protein L3040_004896 [Drepanopeziza brunnea f. sp. 'multigermtubi']|uniref:DUF202 domain-containing protein n=1 Tax=Marssonina brunnea f. sp. multigermtubi (strain MB_m1) TaxID=1072389 RepID=K1X9L9_MARBU|nr:uncharacterized protein MBM_00785 [Drepanopeziza brunnea f. sp. 'multigermtubi' MB_m1]EKD21672.1 hypothetical protein MBM_00785 [Drepanopeziza brunnea f. sp. 'multigermtubi' MB_m1]KAJ5042345.1 hypothetical protein L3040_004896 [Drepanopeziza brunnea f. sp. 'multigermtubi']
MPQAADVEEVVDIGNSYSPFGIPLNLRPVDVSNGSHGDSIFCAVPFFGPLLFENANSDARDHCANERTFLSYLRLSVYMAVVSIAIVVSFHLKSQPSTLELRMARPLGVIFWLLSISSLALGFGNYIQTVNKYSRRAAIVQTGWKTQSVLTMIAFSIVAVCVLFLATNSKRM